MNYPYENGFKNSMTEKASKFAESKQIFPKNFIRKNATSGSKI